MTDHNLSLPTVIRDIFVFGNFRVINFHVEILLWSGATGVIS